jgi:hypothetical protein
MFTRDYTYFIRELAFAVPRSTGLPPTLPLKALRGFARVAQLSPEHHASKSANAGGKFLLLFARIQMSACIERQKLFTVERVTRNLRDRKEEHSRRRQCGSR